MSPRGFPSCEDKLTQPVYFIPLCGEAKGPSPFVSNTVPQRVTSFSARVEEFIFDDLFPHTCEKANLFAHECKKIYFFALGREKYVETGFFLLLS